MIKPLTAFMKRIGACGSSPDGSLKSFAFDKPIAQKRITKKAFDHSAENALDSANSTIHNYLKINEFLLHRPDAPANGQVSKHHGRGAGRRNSEGFHG